MATLPLGTVWLASFPKSGNTWMRVLFANLLFGRETPADINDLPGQKGIVTSRDAFEEQTAVDSTLLTRTEIERLRAAVHEGQMAERTEAAIVKVHDAYLRLAGGAPLLGRGARAALYLVRDPRDVAVSWSFHNDISTADAIAQMSDPNCATQSAPFQIDYRSSDWSNHVLSWLDQRDVPVHLVRYEDLLSNTFGAFADALEFLGARWTQSELDRAIHHASFAELRDQESASGFRERTSHTAQFFREGKAGLWRHELTDALVRQIERAHGAVMDRLGYAREFAT